LEALTSSSRLPGGEKWGAIIAVKLIAAFHTTRLVLAHMKQKRWGRIIDGASALASPFKSVTLRRSMALQAPRSGKSRSVATSCLAAQPTKKLVTVEQVAALVQFLCSDGADSITGAVLPIEGGWTAH